MKNGNEWIEYEWNGDAWKYVHSILVFSMLWGGTIKYKWLIVKDVWGVLIISVFFAVFSCFAVIPYLIAQCSAYGFAEVKPSSRKKWLWLTRIIFTLLYDLIALGFIISIFSPHDSSYYGDHDMGDYWDSRIP